MPLMTPLSFSQRRGLSPLSLSFKLKKENLLKPKTPSPLICSRLLFYFLCTLKTLWIFARYKKGRFVSVVFDIQLIYLNASFTITLIIVVCDPSWYFNTCLIWSVHVVDLHIFATPVGSVHSVECGRDPWWLSIFWTCIILWTGWVRPLCLSGFWTSVGSVPFVGLYKFLTHGGVRPHCGLV